MGLFLKNPLCFALILQNYQGYMAKGKGKIVKAPRGASKRSERSSEESELYNYTPESLFYNDEEKILALLVSFNHGRLNVVYAKFCKS